MIQLLKAAPRKALLLASLLAAGLVAGCEAPPQETEQTGYRGTGMVQIHNAAKREALIDANAVPEPQPEADAAGDKASTAYQNVQVLGHLSETQFLRVMTAMTEWVSPEQGCGYCHNLENLADDSLYTKKVARRMLQMTQHINEDWKTHVAETGVTCYTCHRGNPVPKNIWFTDPGVQARGSAADSMGQNHPAASVARSTLPREPFTSMLLNSTEIRVQDQVALASDAPGAPIQSAEMTYALMTHMSVGLGVNCTFCHNSRSFSNWEQSTPQRVIAWHGIRMVRDLNNDYLVPLLATYPENRLGPEGDAPKANCSTCHQGLNKPLNGVSMLKDYLAELSRPK
jgi:photosynthetic reaction center cytochrome c subunit